MKVEKTLEEVLNFGTIANNYISRTQGKDEKFIYAIKKVAKKIKKHYEDYNDAIFNIDMDTCSVDEKGNILKDEQGNFVFTRENLIKKRNSIKELIAQKVEFDNYIATSIPEDLTEVEIETFKDFVSDKVNVEQEPA